MDAARITAIPIFADLRAGDVARLSAAATELHLEVGEALTEEGEFGHALFAVESGNANVIVDGSVVRTVRPGDVIGEVAILASGRRTATVVATSPMRLIAIFKRDIWELEQSAPEVAERLRDLIASRSNGR